jgi:hypothetical protein
MQNVLPLEVNQSDFVFIDIGLHGIESVDGQFNVGKMQ